MSEIKTVFYSGKNEFTNNQPGYSTRNFTCTFYYVSIAASRITSVVPVNIGVSLVQPVVLLSKSSNKRNAINSHLNTDTFSPNSTQLSRLTAIKLTDINVVPETNEAVDGREAQPPDADNCLEPSSSALLFLSEVSR